MTIHAIHSYVPADVQATSAGPVSQPPAATPLWAGQTAAATAARKKPKVVCKDTAEGVVCTVQPSK